MRPDSWKPQVVCGPLLLAAVTKRVSETPSLPADRKSITSQCWEEALFSTLRTMDKLEAVNISDLDSYLFAIFTYRLNRHLARERKRQQIIEFVPGSDDLAEVGERRTRPGSKKSSLGLPFKRRWLGLTTGSESRRGATAIIFHGSKSAAFLG